MFLPPTPTQQSAGAGELVFFLHIPKAGGSSLRTLVAQNYAPAGIIAFSGDARAIEWFRSRPTAAKLRYRIAHGHFPYGIHGSMQENYAYFTVLREPVDRHFSAFYYAANNPDHRLHPKILSGEVTLERWATIGADAVYHSDTMVQHLSGEMGKSRADEAMLARAFDHL